MENMKVSYTAMQDEATALVRGKDEINSQLELLRGRIANLISSGFVTDSAAPAFNSAYEQYNQSAVQVISNLDNMANMLRQIATTLQETDQALASQIGS